MSTTISTNTSILQILELEDNFFTWNNSDLFESNLNNYYRFPHFTLRPLSEVMCESGVRAPRQVLPFWLGKVEKRIRDSIIPFDCKEQNDGRWLNENVAISAISFFQNVADLLPLEPFIYSSRKNDLVAEFEFARGKLTCVVSPEFVLLFADTNGCPTSEKINFTEIDEVEIRKKVREITGKLC